MFPLHASTLPTRTFLPKIVRRIQLRITLRHEARAVGLDVFAVERLVP
jgi:hypothetical protein